MQRATGFHLRSDPGKWLAASIRRPLEFQESDRSLSLASTDSASPESEFALGFCSSAWFT